MKFEYRIIRNGEVRYMACEGQVDDEYEGDLTYFGVLTDVTERRSVEIEMREFQSQLATANRLASLGELAGSIIHEINQPLTAITTDAEACQRWLAHDPAEIEEVRASIANVLSAASRAVSVVRGLRHLAKEGRAVLVPMDVNDSVRDVLGLLRSDLERAEVAVRFSLQPDLPSISGDRVQLQQVVFNLIQNAVDALGEITDRPRRIVMSTARTDEGRVAVAIEDNGPGASAQTLGRMFQPLFTTRAGGLGLGLTITRNIVSVHGGTIEAIPAEDHGLVIKVTFPACSGACA